MTQDADLDEDIARAGSQSISTQPNMTTEEATQDADTAETEPHTPAITLEEAIEYSRFILRRSHIRHCVRCSSLSDLGFYLLQKLEQNGVMKDLKDLEEAISCNQQALQLLPFGHLRQAGCLTNLAECLRVRYEETGHTNDLRDAISFNRDALLLRPKGHSARPISLNNLALCLQILYQQLGRAVDLEEAISCNREALVLHPVGHPDRPASLNNLANCLLLQYHQRGATRDLDGATAFIQEALSLCPANHPTRPTSLTNFATCLQLRYRRYGEIEDLEKAVSCNREALLHRPIGHRDRSGSLDSMGFCLRLWYLQHGQIADLEEAIAFNLEALVLRPTGHPYRPSSLTNLANCRRLRYQQHGQRSDLDEVVECSGEPLLPHRMGYLEESSSLHNVASCLQTRYEQAGWSKDLDEAILCNEEALFLRPLGHPSRSNSLSSLADCFQVRYQRNGRAADLEEAIFYNHAALLLRPFGHLQRSNSFTNLALCLLLRHQLAGQTTDLLDAINFIQDAIQLQPIGHPRLAYSLASLASAYIAHSATPGQQQLRSDAWDLFELATRLPTAAIHTRFRISLLWVAKSDQSSCLRAYKKCLELADQYILTQPSVVTRRRLLSLLSPTIAADAAARAIMAGEYTMAVEFLEQGRTLLWSQLGRYRSPLDELREVDEELAARYDTLSRQLETSATTAHIPEASQLPLEAQPQNYARLVQDWSTVIDDIRKIDGFGTFLRPAPFKVLREAACSGPVIVPNISRFRSDIIIVRHNDEPLVIPIPHTQTRDIANLSSRFSLALSTPENRTRRKRIREILRYLWEEIVGPVVQKLPSIGFPPGSRIWWCPTFKLASLPLHAAGPYRKNYLNLPDLYISSYTPTLTTLIKSSVSQTPHNTLPSQITAAPTLLFVGQEIGSVRKELLQIQQIISSVIPLLDEKGTYDAVIEGLCSHPWVHLALHGSQDTNEPFRSHFRLHDKPLTLLNLIQARLPEAEFAFLSTCYSAAGDHSAPDEAIHLAAGLLFSGFRSVIGTLWGMADIDGPAVAERVYKHLFQSRRDAGGRVMVDFRDAARALNIAVNALRDDGVPVDRWINFVHIGA